MLKVQEYENTPEGVAAMMAKARELRNRTFAKPATPVKPQPKAMPRPYAPTPPPPPPPPADWRTPQEVAWDMMVAEAEMANLVWFKQRTASPMRDMIKLVSEMTGCSVEDLKGPIRTQMLVRARQLTFWAMRRYCIQAFSYPKAAALLGDRDHTTALHACKRMQPVYDQGVAFSIRDQGPQVVLKAMWAYILDNPRLG